ncbi:hypothetical protein A8C56_23315 [Niabella ginsenosidivorans]|uniref:Uncharacterized protein n=1 Tax=Niabella ginsenosidivorans TaxID=1176587 RepID=A0A1A9IAD0_9BACT|nr:hypothetical protein [Niabella ginsenosidivorans]ANH83514.1 hypothetical protein A8C56_23315 [Niabella ginsenosidivorans]
MAGKKNYFPEEKDKLPVLREPEMKGLEDLSFKLAAITDQNGIKVLFLHINHLIADKKAVNRAKDQIDVIEPGRIKKIPGK